MYKITPISPKEQEQVTHETLRYIQLAEDIFHHTFEPINILFDLTGLSSGMFCIKNKTPIIRYNPYIFAKHFAYSQSNTVPHEAAHYIIYRLYGHRTVRPHGKEWKELMLKFGAEPKRTSTLDLEGIPTRKQKRHPYRCDCRDHLISSRRHNRITGGKSRYLCRTCKGELQPSA